MNEGWYHDPFKTHELRWFSVGHPTDLVRDEDVEAYDPPPDESWDGELTAYEPPPTPDEQGGGDLRRSGQLPATGDLIRAGTDDSEPYASREAVDAAVDRAAASGLAFD